MNLGCMIFLTEFRHLAERLLPFGHKIIGERPSLHPLCIEILIEGSDMPIWEEDEAVAIVDIVAISELHIGGEISEFMVTWYHKRSDVWIRVIPLSERNQWITGIRKIMPELDILYP